MDSRQIDRAMRERVPVRCGGIPYRRIVEYVSWYDGKKIRHLSAVLLDWNSNCTVRVPAELVEEVDQ